MLNKSKHLNLQGSNMEALEISVLSHGSLHRFLVVGGHAFKHYPGAHFVLPIPKYASLFSIIPPIFDAIVPTNKVYFMEVHLLDPTKFMLIYPRTGDTEIKPLPRGSLNMALKLCPLLL